MTQAGAGASAYTILIVDDTPELLEMIQTTIPTYRPNWRVEVAEQGAEGLERFVALRPDCAVIDVRMPGLDGYQVVRALRGDPTTAQTPLLILSALDQDKDKLGGLLSGVDEYLTKPITPKELIAAIERVIGLSLAERERRLRQLIED